MCVGSQKYESTSYVPTAFPDVNVFDVRASGL